MHSQAEPGNEQWSSYRDVYNDKGTAWKRVISGKYSAFFKNYYLFVITFKRQKILHKK